jgi:hypothetical protein
MDLGVVHFKTTTPEVFMIDFPQDVKQPIATEIHQMIDAPSSGCLSDVILRENSSATNDPIYIAAQSIVKSLDQGFSLNTIHDLFSKSYEFVREKQGLSLEDQKQTIVKLIDYIIDITDAPYLPDTLTDPIFKALTPTLLDLFLNFQGPGGQLIPQIHLEKPSPQTFLTFVNIMQDTYADGFQLSDLAVYVEKTAVFTMGFTDLSEQEKIESTCDIVNTIIDNVNFGPLPTAVTSPILKSFTKPLIQAIFSKI